VTFSEDLARDARQQALGDSWRFATVMAVSPIVMVRIDGDASSDTPAIPLVGVDVGARVWCQMHGTQVVITGVVPGQWETVSIVDTTNLDVYTAGQPCQIRKIGNEVTFCGALKTKNTTAPGWQWTNLAAKYRPPSGVREPVFEFQGSGTAHWAMKVYANGDVSLERFSGTPAVGNWFPFYCQWLTN
jgi:hypothetical protein